MLKNIIYMVRVILIVVFVFSFGFHSQDLQSNNQDTTAKSIISISDSLFIAQNKPLSESEWEQIVAAIYTDSRNSMDEIVYDYFSNQRFNGSVVVAKGGIPVFSKHYGYADIDSKREITSESRFQLASVSKQFTAVAVLHLFQKGYLEIDSSMTVYLPELPYKNVTIRHLLSHEAGLPDYMWMIGKYWGQSTPPTNQDIVHIFENHPPKLKFQPGEKFSYSNTGYCFLAAIVERVSGMDFDEYMAKNFFEPFGMEETFAYSAAKDTLDSLIVRGYRYSNKKYYVVHENLMEGTYGDKGIYSTPNDLVKWAYGLQQGIALDQKHLALAFQPSGQTEKRDVHYGLGFRIFDGYNGKMIYHNGSWSGFRTTLRMFPEEDLTVVILANNSFRKTGPLARKLTKVVMSDYVANSVFELADNFINQKERGKIAIMNEKSLEDFRNLTQTMNSMERNWLAYEVGMYAESLFEESFEWYALSNELK